MKIAITPARKASIKRSMIDTQRQIDREMGYSEQFRNQKFIDTYTDHLAKLQHMLTQDFINA
jgi:hypothetical protein